MNSNNEIIALYQKAQHNQHLRSMLGKEVACGNTSKVDEILSAHKFLKEEIPGFFRNAIGNTKDAVVDCLIYHCDVDEHNFGLKAAIDYQRDDLIARLIPISRPKTQRSNILIQAVKSHNIHTVQLLASHCNPLSEHSLALQVALDIQDEDIRNGMLNILYPVSNPYEALKRLPSKSQAKTILYECIEHERLQQKLHAETKNIGLSRQRRKI